MQVRGAGDALYAARFWPASAKIAGRLGWAPKLDPLEVVCDLAPPARRRAGACLVNASAVWPAGSLEVCGGLEPSQPGLPDHLWSVIRTRCWSMPAASRCPAERYRLRLGCRRDTSTSWGAEAATIRADGAVPADRHPSRSHPLPTAEWFDPDRRKRRPEALPTWSRRFASAVRTDSRCRRR